jgi:hypothetical protein
MAAHRFVAVVGARVLPEAAAPKVAAVVRFFLSRGWGPAGPGARMRSRSTRCCARGPRRAPARSCSFLAGGPPGAAARFALSPRAAAAWCLARARGGRRSWPARGGWRTPRRAWSPSSGGRRGARCSRCGKPCGRGSRPPWFSLAAGRSCPPSRAAHGCRVPSDRSRAFAGWPGQTRPRGPRARPGWPGSSRFPRVSRPTHCSRTSPRSPRASA